MLKMKNVLITGEAYQIMLKLGFQPNDILAKSVVSKDRVKSPKSNKFIHIYSKTYKNLLEEYTEEELLLRRDGYIKSPTTNKLIKVFSKQFNLLLPNYNINDLLSLPREQKGDKTIGIAFNNKITLKQQLYNIKPNITINKNIDIKDIIEKDGMVIVYVNATFKHQTYDAFFTSAAIFKDKKLIELFEAKEYVEDFIYTNKTKIVDTVTSWREYKQFLQDDNENKLTDINVETVDLLSLNKTKKEIVAMIQNFTYTNTLFSICKHHMWLSSNAKLLQLLPPTYTHKTSFVLLDEETDDRNYEEFEEVIEYKNKLINEIKDLKIKLLNYFNNK